MSEPSRLPGRGYFASASPPRSGVGRVSRALQEGLYGLPGVGRFFFNHETGYLELGESPPRRIARGVKGLGKSAFYLSFWKRVPQLPGSFLDTQNLAFLGLRNCGIFVHDLFCRTHPDGPEDRLAGRILYRGLADYEFYLVNSEYTRNVLHEEFRVPLDRIRAVPIGCDRTVFFPRPVDGRVLRERWGLPPEAPYLLHVSSADGRKNFPRILEAFGMLSRENPDAILVRVGSPLHARNQRLAGEAVSRLGLAGKVFHLENVPDGDLAGLYNAAAALVHPSIAEGFGLPVLEAQACGCPCLTSTATALPEISGPLCILADPGDTESIASGMSALLHATGRWPEKAAANERFLARFEWDSARRVLRNWMETGDAGDSGQ